MSDYPYWSDFLLDDIDGWENSCLGELFNHRQERNHSDLLLFAVTGKEGVVSRDTLKKRDTSNVDKSRYLRVMPGDIAYNTMRMWQGVSGKSNREGIVSPAYTILEPQEGASSDYFQYLFKLELLIQIFHRNSQGLVDDTLNLKFNNFSPIIVKVPPLPEQKKIASILTSVDDVIEKTEAQISKLQDLKKGMMQELLTKGIGHTEFKDSPVGRIPKGWEVVLMEDISDKITDGEHQTPKRSDSGYYLLSARNIQDGYIKLDDVDYIPEDEYLRISKRVLPKENDILISCSGSVGRSSLMPKGLECSMVRSVAIVQLRGGIYMPQFIQHLISSPLIQNQIKQSLSQQAQANLFQSHIKLLKVVLPPFEEQQQISCILNSMNTNIEVKQRKLQQTQSLKKALMQDLLTGMVKVKV